MKHQLHLRTYVPTYLLALFLFGNQLLANTVHRSFIANNKLQTYCLFYDESNLGYYRAFANTSTQSPVIYHSLQDLSQRSIDKNIEVGTLEGVVDVGALGNATFNLPLELPLGLGAMMPQLSINCNGGNGSQLGKGWALSGLSAITRTSSSNYFESYGFANPTDDEFNDAIDFDKHDRFALDGQRLQNNNKGLADLYYNNAKQKEEYRTFIETYAKITSYGSVGGTNFSPTYFKVITKNNTTITYGDLNKAPNCRVHASSTNSAEVLSWLIARQEDQNGNLIDFEYDYDATYNHTKLTKIKYGHSTLQTINTANVAVDFEYGLRSDISEGYVYGDKFEDPFLLTAIVTSVNGVKIARYEFSYTIDNGFSQLIAVDYKKYINNQTTATKLINETRFNYGSPSNQGTEIVSQLDLKGKLYPIDFNGDGFTDFVSERYTRQYIGKCVKLNQNRNTYEHLYEIWGYINQKNGTFQEVQIKQSFVSQIKVGCCNDRVEFLRLKTGDFDGDGRGDFCVHWASNETNADDCKDIKNDGTSADFKLAFYAYNVYSEAFTQPIADFPINNGAFNKWANSSSIIFPEVFLADFNADGLTDLLWDRDFGGSKPLSWELILNADGLSNFSTVAATERLPVDLPVLQDSLFLADFSGDGQIDILAKGNNTSYAIFSFGIDNLGAKNMVLMRTGALPGNIVGLADFNADGLIDIATHPALNCMPVGGLVNFDPITMHLNTGADFVQSTVMPPELKAVEIGKPSKDHVWFVDVNSDGYSDIIELSGGLVVLEECDCIESPANNYDCWRSEFVPGTKKIHLYNPVLKSYGSSSFPVAGAIGDIDNYFFADINGNGALEFWNRTGNTDAYTEFYPTKKSQLLTQVSDGFGRLTSVDYLHLTFQGSTSIYSQTTNPNTPIGQDDYNYPYLKVSPALQVVKSVGTPDGIGGITSVNYHYTDLVAASRQGVLGFEEIEAKNATTGIGTTVYNSLVDNKFWLPYKILVKEDVPIRETNTSYKVEPRYVSNSGSPYGQRYFVKESVEIDHLRQTSKKTTINASELNGDVDEFGNIEKTTTTWFNSIAQTGTPVHTEITEITYVVAGDINMYNDLNAPENITTTNSRQGQIANPFIRTKKLTYYPKGNLEKTIFDDGNIKEYSIERTYSHTSGERGFLISETLKAASLADRETQLQYSADYRFVTQRTNPLGHTAKSSFEDASGLLHWQEDANGRRTTYTYDNLGRLLQVEHPDGIIDEQGSDWTQTGGPAGSLFYTWSHPQGNGYAKSYKDILGREIRREADIFTSVTSCQLTEFNEKGEMLRSSEQFAMNQSPTHWVNFTYDNFGRKQTIVHPNHTTTYVYTNLITEVTRSAPGLSSRVNSQTTDAAGLLTNSTDMGGTLTYTYYSSGKTKSVATLSGTVSMEYDLHGNCTKLTDPDAGIINSSYNAFDELLETTDAEGNTYNYVYDDIGRTVEQNGPEGPTYWNYDPSGNLGAIEYVEGPNGVNYQYLYNNVDGRLKSETHTILGRDYNFSFSYDENGRLERTTYPNDLVVEHSYDAFGNNTALGLSGVHNESALWQVESIDEKGRTVTETYGNNISSSYGYDVADYGYLNTWRAGNLIDYSYDWEIQTGNLLSRHDINKGLDESFTYDNLDRLLTATVLGLPPLAINYTPNNNGNIDFKSDAGQYAYNPQKPHAIEMLQGSVNPPQHNQYINYTPFKKVSDITEGEAQLYLYYGPEQQRKWAEYFNAGILEKTRVYTNGLYEEDRDAEGNIIQQRSYIMANGKPIAALVQDASVQGQLQYLYTDYLGSLLLTTDDQGNPIHEQNFDAWGNYRDPNTWQVDPNLALTANQLGLGNRGYTFHEHLPEFALINMNGRVYDPVLGRFLSPDPYVQAPTNTQNYNRYSYVVNNPLKYTDPSGEVFGWDDAIVAGVGFVYGYVSYGLSTGDWGWKAVGAGAIGAGVALLGYYSGGATSAAKIAEGFVGYSGHVATVALGYSARYVASATISSMLPSVSFTVGNFTFSVSGGVGFGSGGLTGGINVSGTYTEGKNSYSLGGGFGTNYKAWGANASFNNGAFGIGYYRTYYGSAIGPDGKSNNQIVGGLTISSNDYSLRMENDFVGDREDRWRSGAFEFSKGDFVMGFNVYNNEVGNIAKMDEEGRNALGKCNRPTRDGTVLGAWTNGQTYSSPFWIGVKANGQIHRFGYSHPLVQDRSQNVIHRYFIFGRTNYFNRYDNFQYGFYNYNGFYNPYSLW